MRDGTAADFSHLIEFVEFYGAAGLRSRGFPYAKRIPWQQTPGTESRVVPHHDTDDVGKSSFGEFRRVVVNIEIVCHFGSL